MSLYNLIYGVNKATLFILPMLGKHPDEYPRFRDCFVGELQNSADKDQFGIPKKKTTAKNLISVYTRVGGNNREFYQDEIEVLRKMPTYVRDYDDDFDSTFATFIFSVPEVWKPDFNKIKEGKHKEISDEYLREIKKVYPKMPEKINDLKP